MMLSSTSHSLFSLFVWAVVLCTDALEFLRLKMLVFSKNTVNHANSVGCV